jgi:hypothetical protein
LLVWSLKTNADSGEWMRRGFGRPIIAELTENDHG